MKDFMNDFMRQIEDQNQINFSTQFQYECEYNQIRQYELDCYRQNNGGSIPQVLPQPQNKCVLNQYRLEQLENQPENKADSLNEHQKNSPSR